MDTAAVIGGSLGTDGKIAKRLSMKKRHEEEENSPPLLLWSGKLTQ